MTKDVLKTAFSALLQDICPPDETAPLLRTADEMASGGVPDTGEQRQLQKCFRLNK